MDHHGDAKLSIKFPSFINVFEVPSTSSKPSEASVTTVVKRNRSESKIVYDIINGIFDERTGNFEASSSYCSSVQKRRSECSWDRRLKYWRDMVDERKRIAEFVRNKTGKKKGEVLFNRRTTIDDRDKQTVKRLMDYAERMKPESLAVKQQSCLPEHIDPVTCCWKPELQETLPQAEQQQGKIVEIVGLPEVCKEEQLGKRKERGAEKKGNWLQSKVLEQRIGERIGDIERVVEHYPDIDNLQVVGVSLFKPPERRLSEIELVHKEDLAEVSSESVCVDTLVRERTIEPEIVPDYGVKINDQIFKLPEKRSSKNVEIEVRFDCEPFERVTRRVLRLENIGKKILNGEWELRDYYDKNPLLKPSDKEFVFNHKAFRLISGESLEVYVLYQPRRVDVVKEKWLLKIDPPFFCRHSDSVILRLNGKCRPPVEYVEKLREIQTTVIEKSNKKMMDKLTTGLASLTPLIKPDEQICPYRRALNECELFECYNPGYRCDRYHDLELLRDIHRRSKKPRDPAWDLQVDSLKDTVLRLPSAEERALMFNELVGVLQQMKGPSVDLEVRITATDERDRTRFLYVRGMICSGIEEWEDMATVLEEAFLKPALQRYYDNLEEAEEEDEEETENGDNAVEGVLDLLMVDEAAVRNYVSKKVRRRKVFRDSLYVQTYTHLCNLIEDMVSVIESTEII